MKMPSNYSSSFFFFSHLDKIKILYPIFPSLYRILLMPNSSNSLSCLSSPSLAVGFQKASPSKYGQKVTSDEPPSNLPPSTLHQPRGFSIANPSSFLCFHHWQARGWLEDLCYKKKGPKKSTGKDSLMKQA